MSKFSTQNRLAKTFMVAAIGTVSFLSSSIVNAQLPASTYEFSAFSGTFTEVTGGTNVAAIQVDDGLSGVLPIGFTFNYCGLDYTEIKASSNGWITFNGTVTGSFLGNSQGDLNSIKPALYPLWDDLGGQGGPVATYVTTGTAPNRIFTMEYKNWKWTFGSPSTISFQVKLYETSNLVQFVYRQETSAHTGSSASIGIGDGLATPGFISLATAVAAPATSTTTFTTSIATRPPTNQIYQFKPIPPIDMKADSIIANTPFCSNSLQPIVARVRNQGTATITTVDVYWSVDGVAQPPVTYSGSPITNVITTPNNTALVTLGDVFFPDGASRQIKAWTYQPNGLADEVPADDTISSPIAAGLEGVDVNFTMNDTTICSGTSFVMDAGTYPNNPIYIWSNGSLTQTIDVSEEGTYYVKVQNADGCFDRDTFSVEVHPDPVANSIAIIDNGNCSFTFNVIGAQNVDDYVWDFGDNNGATGNGPQVHTYQIDGVFTASLTLTNQCGSIVIEREIEASCNTTGLNNTAGLSAELKMYPNPAREKVVITHNGGIKMKEITVYNVIGQKVLTANANAGQQELDIAGLAPGIYNVIVDTDKGKAVKKLEVIK